jgi:beta-glucosidase
MLDIQLKAKELLDQMTLTEKASLLSGANFWNTKSIERLGIPSIMLTDGPHGLRKQAGSSDHLGINESVPATCFPTASATACSFDTQLMNELGQALGEECLQEDVSVLLGPGANIKRSPLCGRNFEYISEDPYLTGEMAAAIMNGVQSQGIGVSMKHFAANNQEEKRLVINSVVDERALREIYLTGFETAVKKTNPWTIMCSYNRINGTYSSENKKLLTDILRDEWGFDGVVVTDWGAVCNRVLGLAAGLDLEMPYVGEYNDRSIVNAVNDGTLSEEILDTAALRLLTLILKADHAHIPNYRYNPEAHHNLARKAAAESAVLLKNENALLPLKADAKIALIGAFAQHPRYQGAGSSHIQPQRLDTLCDVLKARNVDYIYAPGYSLTEEKLNEAMLDAAVAEASGSDVAIVCIGLPDEYESEGFDRKHMHLPESHVALLESIHKVNKNIVVLLFCGSAVEMPWLDKTKALLLLYLGGQAGAGAAAELLYGDRCPCGKLAESFPLKVEDNPSYAYFPGGPKTVEYRESIYVGYRYYDKANKPVLFPFGYGLSYTDFEYRDLLLKLQENGVEATLTVRNTGKVAGAEIVQFYVSQTNPSIFKAQKELKSFAKVKLSPGEEKRITVFLPMRSFAYYNVAVNNWCVERGKYIIRAAASSRDIRCEAEIMLDGADRNEAVTLPHYETLPEGELLIPDEEFIQLYGSPLPSPYRQPGEKYTVNSTISDIKGTPVGDDLIQMLRHQMNEMVGADAGLIHMFESMLLDMPLRSLCMFSNGTITVPKVEQIVASLNMQR